MTKNDGQRTLKIPDFPRVRYFIDFVKVPDIVLGEEGPCFIKSLEKNVQPIVDIFNEKYKEFADKENIILSENNIFLPEDFVVEITEVSKNKKILMVLLPEDFYEGSMCYFYVFVYDVTKNNTYKNIRFFAIEKNPLFAEQMAYELQKSNMDFSKTFDVHSSYLCEFCRGYHKNHGPAHTTFSDNLTEILSICGTE